MNDIQELVNQGKLLEAAELAKNHAINFLQNAAMINIHRNEYNEAIKQAKLCTEIEPTNAKLYANLSYFLGNRMRLEEALEAINKALELSFEIDYLYNKAVILSGLRRIDEAIECYEYGISQKEDYYFGHFNLGCLLMLNGEYKRGFELLEYRFKYDTELAKFLKRYNKPVWKGEDIRGKRLLIFSEQGAGDVIQYVRYVSMLKETFLITEMQEELVPLLENLFDIAIGRSPDYDISTVPNLPEYDYIISFASLPFILDFELKNIPSTPYLDIESNFAVDEKKFNIGIVWAGSDKHSNDFNRSCKFENFKILKELPNIELYNLQKGSRVEGIINLELDNFLTTAKIIKKLDLVITVDTAVAHLAGAMGKSVWILLSVCNDYRWGMEGKDTHWYKSMKLFRQNSIGNWDGLIKEVKENLKIII